MNALKIILAVQILFALIAFGIIIYLAIRRIRIRGKEDFERRDN
jgi:flagellar biosynthesis/type III secretory pathway M-ring protein FliF/YscJ